MSKELTEKWKNGELELNSLWFVRLPCGLYDECFYTGSTIFMKSISGHDEKIWQVLEPVPTYEEWSTAKENLDKNGTWYTERAYKELVSKTEQLEKKLEIATKALKEIAFEIGDLESDYGYHYELAKKALKEMEGVK